MDKIWYRNPLVAWDEKTNDHAERKKIQKIKLTSKFYISIFQYVGCDFVIDSAAKEDRCGICHGDGTTCKTVKSQYNDSQGLGKVTV